MQILFQFSGTATDKPLRLLPILDDLKRSSPSFETEFTMNEIGRLSPHNISTRYNRQRALTYEPLDAQAREQVDVFSTEGNSAGSEFTAGTFDGQRARFYERLVLQDSESQSQLRSGTGDLLDIRASRQYSSYLFVEKVTVHAEEQFGVSANQRNRFSGPNTSVEETASFLFELSVTVYYQYEAQVLNVDASANRVSILSDFMRRMHQTINQGLQDATDVLDQMRGFSDDIKSSVEETRHILQKLLARFETVQREHIEKGDNPSSPQVDFLSIQQDILSAIAKQAN